MSLKKGNTSNQKKLAELAKSNEDPKIRIAAIKELLDTTALYEIMKNDKSEEIRQAASEARKQLIDEIVGLCDSCGDFINLLNVYTYSASGIPSTVNKVSRLVCRDCYRTIAAGDDELNRLTGQAHKVAKEYMLLHREEYKKTW